MSTYTKMRLCNAYSNLPPLLKECWKEYQEVRATLMATKEALHNMPEDKIRMVWDAQEKRHRPSPLPTLKEQARAKHTRLKRRLTELAQYLYTARYIAPDFNRAALEMGA
ncbi:hypothetical protein AMA1_57 [Achromobacter phage AMA1]|nr:hypothetical protein AMA1_57 [Achromobacter phage AMA1]